MKEIVFIREEFPHKLRLLTALLNVDGDLVFDDEEFFSASDQADSCEVDHYLVVRSGDKKRLMELIERGFNQISNTSAETDLDRLFHALACVARSGHWRSLGEIETWLMERGISFTTQKRIAHK